MIFGHLRRSTALLGAVFVVALVVYVLVRPPAAPRYTVVTTPAVAPVGTTTSTTAPTTTKTAPTATTG